MGFRPTNSNYQQVKVFSNYNSANGEKFTGGEAVVLSNGVLTAAGATSTLTHIVLGEGTVITAADSILRKNQLIDVIPVYSNMVIEASLKQRKANSEFNIATGAASTAGTVVYSTKFASTAANWYQYGVVYHHGLKQYRRITASSSLAKLTIERPFENPDGTLHAIAIGEKVSISALYPGLATARISTVDTAMHVANKTTGNGKIKIVSIPKLGNIGGETVKVKFS